MAGEDNRCFSSQTNSSSLLVILSVANSCTALTTMALNSVVLFTIWRTTSLHKPSFILLANLALADFLVGAVSQPARVSRNVLLLSKLNLSSEESKWVCPLALVTRASAYWLGAVSMYILTLISIDRMLAVKLKTSYRNVLTTRRIVVALVSFWIISGVLIQSVVFHLEGKWSKFLSIVIMPVGTSGFLLIIAACYYKAIQVLRTLISQVSPASVRSHSHSRSSRTSAFDVKKYQKTLKTMLIIFSAIFVCYIPYILAIIALGVSPIFFPDKQHICYSILQFCDFIVWSSSTVNPLLYLWRMRELRQAARRECGRKFRRHLSNCNDKMNNKSGPRKVDIVVLKAGGVNQQLN